MKHQNTKNTSSAIRLKLIYQGINAKLSYLLLYSIALRTVSHSPVDTQL